jgi:hypothetical protein
MEDKQVDPLQHKKDAIEQIRDDQRKRKLQSREVYESSMCAPTPRPRTETEPSGCRPSLSQNHDREVDTTISVDTMIQSMIDQHNRDSLLIESDVVNELFLSDEYKKGVDDTRQKTDVEIQHCNNQIKYLKMDLQAVCNAYRTLVPTIHSVLRNKKHTTIRRSIDSLSKQIDDVYKKRVFNINEDDHILE